MKAWIVEFAWYHDPKVTSRIVFFGENEDEVATAAYTHTKEHGVNYVERAEWLDKPRSK